MDEKEIIEFYNKGLKIDTIVHQSGLTRQTIYNILKRNNIVTSRTGKNRYNINKLKEGYDIVTDELAYIIGVMLGDGYIVANAGIGLESTDGDFITAFSQCCEKQFGIKPKIYEGKHGSEFKDWRNGKTYERKPTTILRIRSVLLRDYIKTIVNLNMVDKLNEKQKIIFLRGLWDSEGSVSKTGYTNIVNFTHNNRNICEIFQKILLDILHINTTLQSEREQGNFVVYFYKREYIEKFFSEVNPTIQRKRDKFELILNSYSRDK